MPDWISTTLLTLPYVLAVIVGMGLPWALVALPRQDWRDRPLVAALALAFGPALLTAWMFLLGVAGMDASVGVGDPLNPMQTQFSRNTGGTALLTPGWIAAGGLLIAVLGAALAWRKMTTTAPADERQHRPLAPDERVLIGLIALALAGRWVITSWLGFGAWDPQWVYGYQGRIYTLLGFVPSDIGYYPQFMPLQYAFGQIMLGDINDHAARAVMPFVQLGAVLMVYTLGNRLVSRRAGIFAAAIWTLYPNVGYWSRIGDLEIPLTFGFTGAAAFFLMAWRETDAGLRRQYAIIAGLLLGIAMWTKPTGGALIWGVVLAVAVEGLRVGFRLRAWWPRFSVAFWAGLATLPLGSVWYLRNVLIGHDAVTFPPGVWTSRALRSGQEFGWLLAALLVLLAFLYLRPTRHRPNVPAVAFGTVLVLLGIGPTLLQPAPMVGADWLALIAGVAVLGVVLGDFALAHLDERGAALLATLGWALLLGLPYFITYFYSYSYAYRLSFPIVPLMILPTAALLAYWLRPDWLATWRFPLRLGYAALTFVLVLPGLLIVMYDAYLGWDWLWTIPDEDDYQVSGLNGVIATLEDRIEAGEQPVVVAPGLQPLPFFFPTLDIDVTSTPATLADLNGVTHFIYTNPPTRDLYLSRGFSEDYPGSRLPFQSQMFNGLFRENVSAAPVIYEDRTFSFTIYPVHVEQRFEDPQVPPLVTLEQEVVFGDLVRFLGYSYSDTTLAYAPDHTHLHMVFEVLASTTDDYFMYVHLVPAGEARRLAGADGPVRRLYAERSYYSSRFWEPGEIIIDRRIFWYDPMGESGEGFRLRIGFYSQTDGHRLPVTVDGQPVGDGYEWATDFTIPPPP